MFGARTHRVSAPLEGDPDAAFDVARTALLALGFEILRESEDALHARGPGKQSNQQPPLLGVSEFHAAVGRRAVEVAATLGGVARMKAFVCLFPPGLLALLALTFLAVGMQPSWSLALFALPWLAFSPWIASGLERRTTEAVDRLTRGMARARRRR